METCPERRDPHTSPGSGEGLTPVRTEDSPDTCDAGVVEFLMRTPVRTPRQTLRGLGPRGAVGGDNPKSHRPHGTRPVET